MYRWKCCWITFLVLLSVPVFGAGIRLDSISYNNQVVYVTLKAFVKDAIDLNWILDQGINLKVQYSISLYRKNKRWGNDLMITNLTVRYQAAQDVINKGYEVELQYEHKKKQYWLSGKDTLHAFLMQTPPVGLISRSQLEAGHHYYIQFYISITSLDLYPPLSLIYHLLGRWSYTSPRINSRLFSYEDFLED